MGRADIDVAIRGVDGDSRPRRPCYPWGNFSVMPSPLRGGHERSLGRGFPARPLVFKGLVRPAFALTLYGGVLTRLSRPLGARVIFSRACRPSRTAHLTLSPGFPGLGLQTPVGSVSLAAQQLPKELPHSLLPTLRTEVQRPMPGCGKAPQGLLSLRGDASLCTGSVGFTGSRAGTVGPSLIHSCAPELSGDGAWGSSKDRKKLHIVRSLLLFPKHFTASLTSLWHNSNL